VTGVGEVSFDPVNANQDIIKRSYATDDFDQLLGDLVTEIEARNYRITRINHIDNIFDRQEAGIEITARFRHYKIVEFCNLNSCSELISADLRSGVFMPVRFAVYQTEEEENVSHVAFLNPNAFARLFDSASLNQVAAELSKDMTDVLEEMDF
tara:strand:+ start:35 stop:493 length:459 start_codon:yes stop_codon:yes gene_type:complete